MWHWLPNQLADPERKKKPLMYWQSKNEKEGLERKGGWDINFLISVFILTPYILLFL